MLPTSYSASLFDVFLWLRVFLWITCVLFCCVVGGFGSLDGPLRWVLVGFLLVAGKLSTGAVFLGLPLVFTLICY